MKPTNPSRRRRTPRRKPRADRHDRSAAGGLLNRRAAVVHAIGEIKKTPGSRGRRRRARGAGDRPHREGEHRPVPQRIPQEHLPRDLRRLAPDRGAARRRLFRPRGDFHPPGVPARLRVRRAHAAETQHPRGLPRGRARRGRVRRRPGGELHRRRGQPHPGHVPRVAADDLRRGRARRSPPPALEERAARRRAPPVLPLPARSRSAPSGSRRTCRRSRSGMSPAPPRPRAAPRRTRPGPRSPAGWPGNSTGCAPSGATSRTAATT